MRLFGELTKIEDQPDGTLKVYGVASTGARDDAGEIVRPDAMRTALPDYARYPALREMHQPTAAGRTLEALVDGEGATRIVAHVVDPVAVAKVKSRTYSGFSIGGKVLARDPKDPSVITRLRLTEISLVDRPANPEAVIDLWKADMELGEPPAVSPSNEAVKMRAAQMAAAARRPGAWKDYVARARAALVAEAAAAAASKSSMPDDGDEAMDDDNDPPPDDMDAMVAANDNDPWDGDDDEPDDPADGRAVASAAARLAALAASDPDALQAAHDALAALGASCHAGNCPDMGKRLAPPDPARSDVAADALLAKALPRVEALERQLATQATLIERLAAAPMPPRTAANTRAVGKLEDVDPAAGQSADVALDKALAALTPDERAFVLMKASLRQPILLP